MADSVVSVLPINYFKKIHLKNILLIVSHPHNDILQILNVIKLRNDILYS